MLHAKLSVLVGAAARISLIFRQYNCVDTPPQVNRFSHFSLFSVVWLLQLFKVRSSLSRGVAAAASITHLDQASFVNLFLSCVYKHSKFFSPLSLHHFACFSLKIPMSMLSRRRRTQTHVWNTRDRVRVCAFALFLRSLRSSPPELPFPSQVCGCWYNSVQQQLQIATSMAAKRFFFCWARNYSRERTHRQRSRAQVSAPKVVLVEPVWGAVFGVDDRSWRARARSSRRGK